MVKGLVLAAMLLGVLPFLLGLLVTGLKAPKDGMRIRISGIHQERDNLLFHVAAGYIVMFGLFWIVALPMVWLGQTLSLLGWVYAGGMLFLAVVSLLLNYRRLPAVLGAAVCAVKRFTLCIWAQLLFALGQAAVYLRYQYTNADDAFYVASATTSLATDTVFRVGIYKASGAVCAFSIPCVYSHGIKNNGAASGSDGACGVYGCFFDAGLCGVCIDWADAYRGWLLHPG